LIFDSCRKRLKKTEQEEWIRTKRNWAAFTHFSLIDGGEVKGGMESVELYKGSLNMKWGLIQRPPLPRGVCTHADVNVTESKGLQIPSHVEINAGGVYLFSFAPVQLVQVLCCFLFGLIQFRVDLGL